MGIIFILKKTFFNFCVIEIERNISQPSWIFNTIQIRIASEASITNMIDKIISMKKHL